MGGQKKETAEPKEGRNENRAGEEGLGKMMVDNLVDDIIDVPYSESLVMRKAGAWRKVLNQYESGAGLKFTRQPARIEPLKLWGLHVPITQCECWSTQPLQCACPACNPTNDPACLLGVGEESYPTPEDFIQEARTMGVSKRIARIPRDLEPGKTWIYLVHRKAVLVGHKENGERDYAPGVFYAFRPQRIEKLIWKSEEEKEAEGLQKRGITPVIIPDGDADHMPD